MVSVSPSAFVIGVGRSTNVVIAKIEKTNKVAPARSQRSQVGHEATNHESTTSVPHHAVSRKFVPAIKLPWPAKVP